MKRLVLTITIFCIARFGFSQTDYRSGFIINNAGDTLFGLIDYRETSKTYKSCDFMVSKGGNAVAYGPGSIIGYGFKNDKFFQSRELSIKNQPPQTVFVEVIVRGAVSLYKFEETYLVEKGSNGLEQLTNEAREVFVDGKRVVKYTNQHIATLNILLFDCAEIRARVQKIRLFEKDLTRLIEDYNQCKGSSSATFKAKKPWTKLIIGVAAGGNMSTLDFFDTDFGYSHLAGTFESTNSPMIGISFDVSSPRLAERVSLNVDLLYLTSKYYNFTLNNSGSSVERNYVTIELQQFKVPIGIRYTLPKRAFTPYFNGGLSGTIHVGSSSKWVQEVESFGVVNTNRKQPLTMTDKQLGIWGGLGVLKPINNNLNAFLELRYEQTNGIVPFSIDPQALNSKISNFQILIGIRSK